jgi:hypothetical protein
LQFRISSRLQHHSKFSFRHLREAIKDRISKLSQSANDAAGEAQHAKLDQAHWWMNSVPFLSCHVSGADSVVRL